MNDKLQGVSIREMQLEIKRRLSNKPKIQSNIDWSSVTKFVQMEVIDNQIKDYEHYLFEHVMEAMFGVDIWDWWNNKQNEAPQSDQ